ncbi:MAG: precorrin-4 C(11)-methyltransferase [Nitrospinae bacterium]|nr:precorrin-4 C(11)-methyltransferase [Nitrospinota bacterium]
MKGNSDKEDNKDNIKEKRVFFVGAGPGDIELITLKGRRLLDNADVVIYAGSLINSRLLYGIKAKIFDSSSMSLDDIITLIKRYIDEHKFVVRLHTGDISFYSAIQEQIERLKRLGINYEIIPGVSSAAAAAAVLGQELTIPEISQTVIFTRVEGRTPVPENERLSELAKSRATMAIFLSVGMIDKTVAQLMEGYPDNTSVVVIEKASWPEQRVVRGTLKDIPAKVKDAQIKKTAIILVGDSLKASEVSLGKESILYNKGVAGF